MWIILSPSPRYNCFISSSYKSYRSFSCIEVKSKHTNFCCEIQNKYTQLPVTSYNLRVRDEFETYSVQIMSVKKKKISTENNLYLSWCLKAERLYRLSGCNRNKRNTNRGMESTCERWYHSGNFRWWNVKLADLFHLRQNAKKGNLFVYATSFPSRQSFSFSLNTCVSLFTQPCF